MVDLSQLFNQGKIVFDVIIDAKCRDDSRSSKLTALTNDSIDLHSWNKMRVSLAKVVFETRTINEIITYACTVLRIVQCPKPTPFELENNKCLFMKHRKKYSNIYYGEQLWIIRNLMCLDWPTNIFNILHTAEFLCVVNDIFNSIFLNIDERIDKENVKHVQSFLDYRMNYFHEWQNRQLIIKENEKNIPKESKTWQSTFLSHQTYFNLRLLVSGFMAYAKYKIEQSDEIYIPMLHSNQSFLESYFSHIRAINQNVTPATMISSTTTINIKLSSKFLNSKTSYDRSDCLDDHLSLSEDAIISNGYKKNRTVQMNKYINFRKIACKVPSYVHQIQDVFTELISNYNSDQEVFCDITSTSIKKKDLVMGARKMFFSSIKDHHTSATVKLQDCCIIKHYTQLLFHEGDRNSLDHILDFLYPCNIDLANRTESIICVLYDSMFIALYKAIIMASKGSCLDDLLFNERKLELNKQLFRYHNLTEFHIGILLESLVSNFRDFINDFVESMNAQHNAKFISDNDMSLEYNGYIGFAIFSAKKKLLSTSDSTDDEKNLLSELLDNLDELSEKEILELPLSLKVSDRGRYSYPSKHLQSWGYDLLSVIRNNVNMSLLNNSILEDTWNMIASDENLKEKFRHGIESHLEKTSDSIDINKLYEIMSKKVFHARSGEIINRCIDSYIAKSSTSLRTKLKVESSRK